MTDPMLTGNPAIVTIEGSLRIIDLYEKVFYSCISRLLVLWAFLLKTIGLIKKKIVKNKRIKMSMTENFEKKQNAVVVKRKPGREEALDGQKQFFLPCKGF